MGPAHVPAHDGKPLARATLGVGVALDRGGAESHFLVFVLDFFVLQPITSSLEGSADRECSEQERRARTTAPLPAAVPRAAARK